MGAPPSWSTDSMQVTNLRTTGVRVTYCLPAEARGLCGACFKIDDRSQYIPIYQNNRKSYNAVTNYKETAAFHAGWCGVGRVRRQAREHSGISS